jgi:hypothetical protein
MARLQMGPAELDESATASLRRVTLRSKNHGDLESAAISAGFHAKKQKKTMYVYSGNSFGRAVWRVSFKSSDYLNPIDNTGSRILSVTPDLVASWYEVSRPKEKWKGSNLVSHKISRSPMLKKTQSQVNLILSRFPVQIRLTWKEFSKVVAHAHNPNGGNFDYSHYPKAWQALTRALSARDVAILVAYHKTHHRLAQLVPSHTVEGSRVIP